MKTEQHPAPGAETDEAEQAARPIRIAALAWTSSHALALMFALYCLVALVFVFLGNTNRDEGWYLYAARLVYEGKIPYRDFPYFQMPLLPYVYGLPQLVFGHSLLVGRLTSFALSLVTVGVGARLSRRIAGQAAALLFLAFTVVSVSVMWTYTTTRTEPLVTPLVMLSLFFMVKENRGTLDLVLAPSLMLWAAAVRLTALLPFAAVLLLCLYQARKSHRQWDWILAAVGLQAIVFFVLPLVLSGDKMVFDVWTSQDLRSAQMGLQTPWGALLRDRSLILSTLLSFHPLVTVLTISFAFLLALLWRNGWRPSLASLHEFPSANLAMLSLATLIFLPHLLLNPVWQFYFVTPFAVLAVMAATAVSKLGQLSPPGLGKLVIPSVVAGLLVLEGVHFAAAFPDPITGFNTADPSLLKYHEVADYLRSTVPADKQIVSFDVGIVLEADRRLAPGLEMSLLSYWPGLQTARARHFGVLNTPLFEQVVSDSNSGALAFTDGDLVFIERALPPGPEPTFKSVEEMILGVVPGAEGKYRLARTFPGFPQEPGNLYVLLRNN